MATKFTLKALLKRTKEKTSKNGNTYRNYWIEKVNSKGEELHMDVHVSNAVRDAIENEKWTFPCDIEVNEKVAFFDVETWTGKDGIEHKKDILVLKLPNFTHKEHTFPKTAKVESKTPEDWLD